MNMFRFRDRVGVLDERSQHFLKTVAWLGGYVTPEQAQELGIRNSVTRVHVQLKDLESWGFIKPVSAYPAIYQVTKSVTRLLGADLSARREHMMETIRTRLLTVNFYLDHDVPVKVDRSCVSHFSSRIQASAVRDIAPPGLCSRIATGLQRHAQLDSEDPDVRGALVAAGIDNPLKIRLNVCPVEDVERVENFLYKLIGLHAETGMRMAGDVFGLGLPYIAGNAVITGCYTAGIVGSLRPRGPVVESSEHLKVLK